MSNKVLLLQEIEKVLPEVDKLLLEERNETMTIPASPPRRNGICFALL